MEKAGVRRTGSGHGRPATSLVGAAPSSSANGSSTWRGVTGQEARPIVHGRAHRLMEARPEQPKRPRPSMSLAHKELVLAPCSAS
jgi:hypothetical protein